MNALDQELLLKLCPTDSRLRPDQKALEFRNLPLAKLEKNRLEINQRQRRKQREQNNTVHQPVWFEQYLDQDTQESVWGYRGGYWETRFFYNQQNLENLLQKPQNIGKSG
jgi:hypothetical protein